ncbi:MAG: PAS domain-containing protein, partial [Ferruginibacter sp.]
MGEAILDFLQGGGTTGEEIRNFDWENSSLGSPETWPAELKFSLKLVLNSAVPMQIMWGKNFIHFYNDYYLPILKNMGKNSMIGVSGRDSFADVCDHSYSKLESTMQGKPLYEKDFEFTFVKEGEIVKCYFDFSYNPIILENKTVGGIFITVNETTDRVNAIRNTISSNERFQFALNAADLGSFEYDLIRKNLILSDRTRQIFGFKPDEAINAQSIYNCMESKYVENAKNSFTSLTINSKDKFILNFEIKKADTQEKINIKCYGMLIQDTNGINIKFYGTVQDITADENNRKSLQESEQNLKDLFKNAPVAFCILKGKDFIVEMANDKMLKLIKRNPAELINKSADSSFSPSVIKQLIPALESVYNSGESFVGNEYPMKIWKNNVQEIGYVNFIAQKQEGTDRVIVVATDVTDQVLYRKNIEKNEQQFHEMANSLSEKVWSVDNNDDNVFISERWKEYSGSESSKDLFFELVHPSDVDKLIENWAYAKTNKIAFRSEVRLKSKEGEYRWHFGNANPIINELGEVEKWVGT